VQKFNIKIQSVPSNIIAGMFHFKEAQFFAVAEQDRSVPQVKF
jgi:LemA protein